MAARKGGPATIADRVAWIMEHRGLTAREFSRVAGLSENTVTAILRRIKRDPAASTTVGTLRSLAKAGGVDFTWLALGEGAPFPERVDATKVIRLAAKPPDDDGAKK